MVEPAGNVTPLPRGRHRLSREQVLASQRGRMLQAMAWAVGEKGYPQTTVADVLGRARVSRETFYEHFADKEDCFLAAYEASIDLVSQVVSAAMAGRPAAPLARLRRALAAYFDTIAQEGSIARVFLVDVYAAGPRALERRSQVMDRFVDLIAGVVGATSAQDRFAVEAFVGAVSSLVTLRVATGRYDELPELLEPVMRLAPRFMPARRRSA